MLNKQLMFREQWVPEKVKLIADRLNNETMYKI